MPDEESTGYPMLDEGSVGFFGGGEVAGFDVGYVVLYGFGHYAGEVGVTAQEAGGEAFVDP